MGIHGQSGQTKSPKIALIKHAIAHYGTSQGCETLRKEMSDMDTDNPPVGEKNIEGHLGGIEELIKPMNLNDEIQLAQKKWVEERRAKNGLS
jgi:hypothetical protein